MTSYGHTQYRYASIPLPEQPYSSLPYTTPSFAPKPDGLSSALLAAQERASRKRVVCTTCLITTLIFISLIGLNAVLLSYICIIHQCQLSNLSIVSTAPLGAVLAISQITSHVAPVSVPIIMGLFSYLLAAKWLRSSLDGGPNRPSPMQLGLLMSMCNGANITSLFSSVRYVLQRPPDSGDKIARPPPILRQSIFFLGSLLVVTYVAAAADSWLHASSKSILISSNSPYRSSIVPNFGREINATRCQFFSSKANGSFGRIEASTCGLINSGSGGSGTTLAEGIRVVSNTSDFHRVALADDQTAILVPQSLPSNITYSAQTLGVKTQCITITKECAFTTGGLGGYGPNVRLNLNCSKAGIKYANGTDYSPLCALDDQGVCIPGYEIPSNPFTAGEVMTSQAYLNQFQVYDTFIGNTGWFVHGNQGAWNVVFCNVTALEVTYTYASSRYLVQSSIPKSLTAAQYMMSAGFQFNPTTVVSYEVDGAGLKTNTTYEQAYSLELSRQMLARGALIYEPTNVIRIESENNANGSKLKVFPLALFIAALLVFACQVLYISLIIVINVWDIRYVGLTALHLRDPRATVQRLYGHPDPVLTWETDPMKKFGLETEGDRLHVGPVLSGDGEPSSVFIITRG